MSETTAYLRPLLPALSSCAYNLLCLILRLVVAYLTTVQAVILSVLAEAHTVVGVAKGAKAITDAALLGQVAGDTSKFCVGHRSAVESADLADFTD